MKHFLENKAKGRRYEILAIDKIQDPPLLTLQGEHGPFTQAYDTKHISALGYELTREETETKEAD